jgi:DNA-binding GntR family transcriptional regulator
VFLDAAGVPHLADAARKARRVFHGQAVWSSSAEVDELYERDLQQHRAIVEAFAARDPEVRALVERHVLDSVQILELALDEAGFGRRRLFSQRVSWLGGDGAASAVEAASQ